MTSWSPAGSCSAGSWWSRTAGCSSWTSPPARSTGASGSRRCSCTRRPRPRTPRSRACHPRRRRAFVTGWPLAASAERRAVTQPSDAGSGAEEGIPLPAAPDPSARSTPRRRTHPLTPLVASVRSLGVLVGIFVVFGSGNLRDLAANLGGLLGLVILLGAFAVLMLVSLGFNYRGVEPHGVLLRRVRRLPSRLRGAAAQRAPRDPVAPSERRHDPAPARSGRGAVPGPHRGGRRGRTRGCCSPTSPTPRPRRFGPRSSRAPRGCPRTWARLPKLSSRRCRPVTWS